MVDLTRQHKFMDTAHLLQIVHLEIAQKFKNTSRAKLSKN